MSIEYDKQREKKQPKKKKRKFFSESEEGALTRLGVEGGGEGEDHVITPNSVAGERVVASGVIGFRHKRHTKSIRESLMRTRRIGTPVAKGKISLLLESIPAPLEKRLEFH